MKELDLLLNEFKKKKFTKTFDLHRPHLGSKEMNEVKNVIKSTWVSTKGKKTKEFENILKKKNKCKYAIALNSGTSGIFLALKALKIEKNHEVIIPNLTFVATGNAVIYCNAIPHIVDVSKNNLNICPIKLHKHLLKNTKIVGNECFNLKTKRKIKAIIAVHVYGHICDMLELKKISKTFKIPLIEDAAEAFGSLYNNKPPGYYSTLAVLSFNGNKIITSGGGGAIIANDKKLANNILALATVNNKKNTLFQDHLGLGYNMRMPSLNAALGIAQTKNIKKKINKKRHLFYKYEKFFEKKNNKYFTVYRENNHQRSNYWLQALILKSKYKKDLIKIKNKFKKRKIAIRLMWTPISKIDYFKKYPKSNLDNSLDIYKRVICIPSN